MRKRRKKTTNMKSRQPFVEEELFMAGRDGSRETMDDSDEEEGLRERERERERAMGRGDSDSRESFNAKQETHERI